MVARTECVMKACQEDGCRTPRDRFVDGSALEERGFEPPVPLAKRAGLPGGTKVPQRPRSGGSVYSDEASEPPRESAALSATIFWMSSSDILETSVSIAATRVRACAISVALQSLIKI